MRVQTGELVETAMMIFTEVNEAEDAQPAPLPSARCSPRHDRFRSLARLPAAALQQQLHTQWASFFIWTPPFFNNATPFLCG